MICDKCGEESELAFRRTEDTARMTAEDREVSCKKTMTWRASWEKSASLSEQYYHFQFSPWAGEYNMGLRVEVHKAAFRRVLNLWLERGQASEPAFLASVPDEIPSLRTTYEMLAEVKLAGPI